MSARDYFKLSFECPNCNQKGCIECSENDYLYMRKVNRKIEKIEGKFNCSVNHDNLIAIKCNECSMTFFKS